MKRISKRESKEWNDKIVTMLKSVHGAGLVENRYRAMKYLLNSKYKEQAFIDRDQTLRMLKDAIYLDRKMRWWTEGRQKELKKTLSEQFQVEELGCNI